MLSLDPEAMSSDSDLRGTAWHPAPGTTAQADSFSIGGLLSEVRKSAQMCTSLRHPHGRADRWMELSRDDIHIHGAIGYKTRTDRGISNPAC
eukprot:2242410-Pyramimonas_sp.AAC.1